MRSAFAYALIVAGCLALFSCGGGGGGNGGTPPPPPPPPPTITIGPNPLPGGIAGQAYSVTLTASGGTAPYTFGLSDPEDLPSGMTFTSGVLSGTYPNTYGGLSEPLRFTVTDASGATGTATLTLNLFGMAGGFAPPPQVGVLVGYPIMTAGGTEPISWSTTGELPPGLALKKFIGTAEYAVEGTPRKAGAYTFTVTATDASSPARSVSSEYTVRVEPAKLVLGAAIPPPAIAGQPYSYKVPLQGGQGPFHWTVPYGSLPNGLSLDAATGLLSGTVPDVEYSGFTIQVTDTSSPTTQFASANYWLLSTRSVLPPRNDTIGTATPILPGGYTLSISPLGDPAGTIAPDQDYFVATANGGDTFRLTVDTYNISNHSNLDPVIELLDANGRRLSTCNDPFVDNVPPGVPVEKNPSPNFSDSCMNHIDPTQPGTPLSSLEFRAPGSSAETVQFYIHVFDFRGDARPDMLYTLYFNQE